MLMTTACELGKFVPCIQSLLHYNFYTATKYTQREGGEFLSVTAGALSLEALPYVYKS
jgi:hypothetical protein